VLTQGRARNLRLVRVVCWAGLGQDVRQSAPGISLLIVFVGGSQPVVKSRVGGSGILLIRLGMVEEPVKFLHLQGAEENGRSL